MARNGAVDQFDRVVVSIGHDIEASILTASLLLHLKVPVIWAKAENAQHGRIRAGVVHVNTYGGTDLTVPLGGVKQSGNGHDKSLHAFDKYLDLKTAWIKLEP